jgi:uncharacterized protein YdeI (YjbR/CyaY-like superfamily)
MENIYKINPKLVRKELEPKVPTDLRKALIAKPLIDKAWGSLTPIARRDFITWIEHAKLSETRTRRIEITCSKLAKGDRRPCCYAVVPMNLYKALSANPNAKATWSTLSPSARRDFVSWIHEAKDTETRSIRIEEACIMLTTGKQRP